MKIAVKKLLVRGKGTLNPKSTSTKTGFVQFGLIVIQILGLWVINQAGYWLEGAIGLEVPGNVLGLLILFGLLWSGIVRVEWFDLGSSFLTRHLSFFFIPIAVGLMDLGEMWSFYGLVLLAILLISALLGIFVSSQTVTLLETKDLFGNRK
ncbi:MAG TPA: CidA/LrgA family protein [Chloroflexia bacterium]|nr:CidA/LrgA family protein [Chloroflexia bacterium]